MLILVGIGLVVLANAQWLLPMALTLGLIYLIYFAIRTWSVRPKAAARAARVQVPVRPASNEVRQSVRRWLAVRPLSDRASELIGSLLMSAVTCGVFCFLAMILAGNVAEWTLQSQAIFAWLCITCVSASWSLLFLGKIWEQRDGEQVLRRFAMLALGLTVGAVSFVAASALHVDWASGTVYSMQDMDFSPLELGAFSSGGAPNIIAYLVFFAALFAILRWWKQADPTRRTRLSILSVGLCLIWAVVLGQLFYFPQPWSMVVAVVVALSTQLSAPWLHPSRRLQIASESRDVI